ncbi:MAG: hypothetical protein COX48_05030 [bacterium (Candidatus Stahlbacteria) CG23_combo_of_CG06-09_8_20_14_all_34_7]|nr:MAG: hypothetical protein COX48_05030 [bacterium (Candidatus Stahlbacteria) CG23_combo_of_CG06-09_8_20_14_all_34_7]
MFIDLHNHSVYSYDSTRNMERIITEAIEKNLSVLGFSDHLDFNQNDPGNEYYNGYSQFREFNALKEKYSSKIKLLLGIEASLEKSSEEKIRNTFSKFSFSYKIISAHFIQKTVISNWVFEKEKTAKNIDEVDYSPYFKALNDIADFDDYDILGHIDYYKKYSKFIDHKQIFEKHIDDYRNILKKVINSGKIIEINSSGLRHKCIEQFPSVFILELYKELGGKTVATGSDSHKVGDVAFDFKTVYNIIEENKLKIFNPK